uniref:coagulation factor IXb n=1 Tax=Monopterus albus TaxID=43700 RepID=UPI0009B4C370|nr:coagulation factor IX-like [Monopterus albus]
MAGVCLLALVAGLLLEVYGLAAEIPEKKTGAVFASQQAAHAVLQRQRRYNSNLEEMFHKDDLERECKEESCSIEEAREVFENDEKTMEFWAGYTDGDQCDPPPCQNGGVCEDGVGSYVCWCNPNFTGKNCEIEVTKHCSINNGGCSHFCVLQMDQPVCQCATGYRLGANKKSCEATGPFSCGQVSLSSTSVDRSPINPRPSNMTLNSLREAYYDDNITQSYDYYDHPVNDSDPFNSSVASAIDIRAPKPDSNSSINPVMSADDARNVTETPSENQPPSWAFFPTLPTITAKKNNKHRIVGGNEATPGEIPWQVALVSYSADYAKMLPFCGGSLLRPFSCGQVSLSSTSVDRSLINPRSSNMTLNGLQEAYYDDNITQSYDYYNHPVNDSDPFNSSVASAIDIRAPKPDSNSSINPVMSADDARNVTETPSENQPPSWAFFPTLPTITAKKNNKHRIVGGNEATPGEIPWQVALVSYSADYAKMLPFCGGSLLSDLWVITAAHCLIPKKIYFVRVGEHDVSQDEGPERDHVVADEHIHHSYNYTESPYNHDIALLKLADPVEMSDQRRPICLGPKDFIEDITRESRNSLVSGWGTLRSLGLTAPKLQKLEVPYVERTLCKQSSRDHITRFMFCAGYHSEQKDSCQGDSGGPHATNYKGTWFLTGIISWGEGCAQYGKYGIYTRLSQYYTWISQTTRLEVSN